METNNIIVHISEVDILLESGMGRVEYYWKKAFEKAGFTFIHIGPNEVGKGGSIVLYPFRAYRYFKKLKVVPRAIIVHEALSGYFIHTGIPCFVESHGLERRDWADRLNNNVPQSKVSPVSLKSRLFFPVWRLFACDWGLKHAQKLLLINTDDKEFAKTIYGRHERDILLFKNGVSYFTDDALPPQNKGFTILFNGGWIDRKGIRTLLSSAKMLYQKGLSINYLLVGTGKNEDTVLADWPEGLRGRVTVIKEFKMADEAKYLSMASVFVLPSFMEGQPLSLLQAMAAGLCCITTNCCGQKDLVTDGINGLLFEVNDHQKLTDLIACCYKNPERAKEIGTKASHALTGRTWEKVAAEVVNFVVDHTDKNPLQTY